MPGVNIIAEGSRKILTTDADGQFNVLALPGDFLRFTFVGYFERFLRVTEPLTDVRVVMNTALEELDEVLVLGYSETRRSDLTGAVSPVKSENLNKNVSSNVTNMLIGQVAGLQVWPGGWAPGSGGQVQIRGGGGVGSASSPLWVVDGFPMSGNPLNNLNPEDIETIEILKDASATAIYGASAGNGVVLVTTKRGEFKSLKVNYSLKLTSQKLGPVPEMLDPEEYMLESNAIGKELWLIENKIGVYGPNTEADILAKGIDPFKPKYSELYIRNFQGGTDWLDEMIRLGIVEEHNLSVSGGGKRTRVMGSLSYYKQAGVIIKSGYERWLGRLNFDHHFSDSWQAEFRMSAKYSEKPGIKITDEVFQGSGTVNGALLFSPLLPIYDENGEFSVMPERPHQPNPVSLFEIQNDATGINFNNFGRVTWSPIEGLKTKVSFGLNSTTSETRYLLPTTTYLGKVQNGMARWTESKVNNISFDFSSTYTGETTSGDEYGIMAGYAFQKVRWENIKAFKNNLGKNEVSWWMLEKGTIDGQEFEIGAWERTLASLFTRFNYTFRERYLLTMTMRFDGSSKFSESNRFALFPSMALAWKVGDEDFLKNWKALSSLKLRLGVGQVGDEGISGSYKTLYYEDDAYVIGEERQVGSVVFQSGNPDLRWEVSTEVNFGMDFSFFDNRVNGSLDVYTKWVDGLLAYAEPQSWEERGLKPYNIGSTVSRGFELAINTVNINKGGFRWNSSFNIFGYEDYWRKMDEQIAKKNYQSDSDPLYPHFYYESDGLVMPGEELPHMPSAVPGDVKLKDINADGKLDHHDMINGGNSQPDFQLGFGNEFYWKNFDLKVYTYGKFGFVRTNNVALTFTTRVDKLYSVGANRSVDIKDRWNSENQTSEMPSGMLSRYGYGDYFDENISFLRIRNITLGYTLPEGKIKGIRNLRLYLDLSNPDFVTNYKGLDPEFDGNGQYPSQRSYTLGLNLSL
ncbi:SusC/RagA family TonB-linked outer membrane protein [Fulvitalea axinellae]|uniref:SusC/RagA family TonB-linked outer membrane protein n=2 Tax=Fulvitalea axinellae TaxID=1182444 RepID=A0AAU9CPZ1_9BACT|nr:SusC/RagA family TonB-linked outer membrane protein [Fulvitalea axinellae]